MKSFAIALVAGGCVRAAEADASPHNADCAFSSSYPKQYLAYKLKPSDNIVIDGRLDDNAWENVSFTEDFVDISTSTIPQYSTKVKIRWDDEYLYIGAVLEEPSIWANITSTCHCVDDSADQVIFHDNDFEIFIDPDGNTHYYKEFEMNAMNATWDLALNKPYADGGYENSSRVIGVNPFDMQPPLRCAVALAGTINQPDTQDRYYSVEVALPLTGLVVNETVTLPPKDGTYWRINFSRVEWNTIVANGMYVKDASCQSCAEPGSPVEDNWVWSPQGQVNMHAPETWGFLQFSDAQEGSATLMRSMEWPVRSVAMIIYNAEHSYFAVNGMHTDDIAALAQYADPPILRNFTCSSLPTIKLLNGGSEFIAEVSDYLNGFTATITNDRLLVVVARTA